MKNYKKSSVLYRIPVPMPFGQIYWQYKYCSVEGEDGDSNSSAEDEDDPGQGGALQRSPVMPKPPQRD